MGAFPIWVRELAADGVLGRVLVNSVWGGVLILAVIVVRRWARGRVAGWALCAVWGLVMVRLLVPVEVPSPVSVLNASHAVGLGPVQVVKVEPPPVEYTAVVEVSTGRVAMVDAAAIDGAPASSRVGASSWSPARVALACWLGGVAVVCVLIAVGHARASRAVRGARQFTDERVVRVFERAKAALGVKGVVTVAEGDSACGPLLVGVIRPAVIVPRGLAERLDDESLELVLRHELAHVRRLDLAWSWLWAATAAVHWFNPLVWWGAHLARADRELACDARVLGSLNEARRPAYGRTLLSVLEATSPVAPLGATGMAAIVESPEDLKRRIVMIASFTPVSRTGLVFGLSLLAVGGVCTLTAAQPNEGPVPVQIDMSAKGEFTLFAQGLGTPKEGKLVVFDGLEFKVKGPDASAVDRRIEVSLVQASSGKPALVASLAPWQARFFRFQVREATLLSGGKAKDRPTRAEYDVSRYTAGADGSYSVPGRATLQALPQLTSDPADMKVIVYNVDLNVAPLRVEVGPATMSKLLDELTGAMEKAGIPTEWDREPGQPAVRRPASAPAPAPAAPAAANGEERFVFDIANRGAKSGWIVLPGGTTVDAVKGDKGGLTVTFTDPTADAPQKAPVRLELGAAATKAFIEQLEKAVATKVDLEREAADLASKLRMSKEKVLEGIRAEEAARSGPVVVNISPRNLRLDKGGQVMVADGQELSVRPPAVEGSVDITRPAIMVSPLKNAPNSAGCTMIAYITTDVAAELLKKCKAAVK